MSEVRQRRSNKKNTIEDNEKETEADASEESDEAKPCVESLEIAPGTFRLTRIFFLRYLAFIYLTAFVVSYNQNKELIGNNGLTPASNFLLNGE